MDQNEAKQLYKRILLSRMRILNKYPFYGLLLMHLKFALTAKTETCSLTSDVLYFNPNYLNELDNLQLDLVMLHNILHLALDHIYRSKDFNDKNAYQTATDLIVNSNIYDTLVKTGSTNMIAAMDGDDFKMEHIVKHNKKTEEACKYDVESLYELLLSLGVNSKKGNGRGSGDGDEDDDGNSGSGSQDKDKDKPNGKGKSSNNGDDDNDAGTQIDDHTSWDEELRKQNAKQNSMMWRQRMMSAAESLQVSNSKNAGTMPGDIMRIVEQLKHPQHNWKEILQDFIQDDINDYSFNPPDRRYGETDFFLPDYNEKDEEAKNILFMIDTSGSMSDNQIMEMYSEIKGAIDQFNGHLSGKLGFFDAMVVPPTDFCNEDEFKVIKPYGGGGTSFSCIFDYVREEMQDNPPASIIIMTDGYAPWPDEVEVPDIPLLWIINNEERTPPYGRVIRIKSEDDNDF